MKQCLIQLTFCEILLLFIIAPCFDFSGRSTFGKHGQNVGWPEWVCGRWLIEHRIKVYLEMNGIKVWSTEWKNSTYRVRLPTLCARWTSAYRTNSESQIPSSQRRHLRTFHLKNVSFIHFLHLKNIKELTYDRDVARTTFCRHARVRYSEGASGFCDGSEVRCNNFRRFRDIRESVRRKQQVCTKSIAYSKVSSGYLVRGVLRVNIVPTMRTSRFAATFVWVIP